MSERQRTQDPSEIDPRVIFSAERTLLSWIRSGVAMMGFGFVVARFGIFLRELAEARGAVPLRHSGLSLWTGSALVLLGVVVNLVAAFNYASIARSLKRGEPIYSPGISMGIVATGVLTVLGLAMVVYLVLVGQP